MRATSPLTLFLLISPVLALIAWASPMPDRVTDRGIYEATAEQIVVHDCSDLQCFRVLVPWVLGRLPGPSALRWKAYAAAANAAGAAGGFAPGPPPGLSPRPPARAAVF